MMSIHRTIPSLRQAMRQSLLEGRTNVSVGFVPTMGALHDGHLSLVKEARKHNDTVVVSIFVNPTQFAAHEDLDQYPRVFERDIELLSNLGVDYLFAPDASSMYGPNHVIYVVPEGFDEHLAEGRARPGHFRGVATIVTKFFNIVQPTVAYFGQKDAAQCALIRRIVDDLNMNVQIHVVETIREADGLALSSRNAYLSPMERAAAPIVYQSLCATRDWFYHHATSNSRSSSITSNAGSKEDNEQESGISTSSVITQSLRDVATEILQSERLVSSIQYISIDHKDTMQPCGERVDSTQRGTVVVSVACTIGKVRLIDNIVL